MIRFFCFITWCDSKKWEKQAVFSKKVGLEAQTHMGKEGQGEQKHQEMPGNWSTYIKKLLWLDLSDAMWFTKWQAFCKECLFALSCPVMGGGGCCV